MKHEEERMETEEANWWGNDTNEGSRFEVGREMTGKGWRRSHVHPPTEVKHSSWNAQS